VTVTADANANAGLNATNAAAQAQGAVTAIQKTVADACPIIVTGVSAINSASKASLSAGK
jgi:DNA-binding FrmR family transcriptional regulator